MQVVPHITDEIKHRIKLIAESQDVDVVITEVGGTVGDIESLPFLEAIRQFPVDVGRNRCMFIHLTLVPYIGHAGELKTKPTQHSVNELRRIGIQPDMLMCRSEGGLAPEIRKKIALFASLPVETVISARDVDNIYKVPLVFHAEGVDDIVLDHFGIEAPAPELGDWQQLVAPRQRGAEARRRCGSRSSASTSSSRTPTCRSSSRCATPASSTAAAIEIDWVDSETLDDAEVRARLEEADGILIPGGFGVRGIEGKIAASRIAREQQIPYLGVCLGMQMAVADFARHVVGMDGANSTEFDPETPYPVIDLLPEQKEVTDMGGTMRLGADPIKLHEGTRAREIYGEAVDLRAPPPPLRGQQLPAQAARGRGPGRLGHLARRAPGRGHRARATTRSSSPRSTTRSSSRAPSGPRRCSASSSARRSSYASSARRARGARASTTTRRDPRRARAEQAGRFTRE